MDMNIWDFCELFSILANAVSSATSTDKAQADKPYLYGKTYQEYVALHKKLCPLFLGVVKGKISTINVVD